MMLPLALNTVGLIGTGMGLPWPCFSRGLGSNVAKERLGKVLPDRDAAGSVGCCDAMFGGQFCEVIERSLQFVGVRFATDCHDKHASDSLLAGRAVGNQ